MRPAPESCVACGDEAVVARVVRVESADAWVVVTEGLGGSHPERVAVDLVPDAAPGDLLLCHAGIALARTTSRGETQ